MEEERAAEKEESQRAKIEEEKSLVKKLIDACSVNKESTMVSQLFNSIMKLVPDKEVPRGTIHIGAMSLENYRDVMECCTDDLFGVTIPLLKIITCYIIIFLNIIKIKKEQD